MAGYIDGAISPEVTESQGPSTVEFPYSDAGVVPEAPEADVQDYTPPAEDDPVEPAGEHYRYGALSDDEAARIAAGGEAITTAE